MTYLTFIHHPLHSLAFISLILAFVSLWIHKSPWLWGSFITVGAVFGIMGKLIDFKVFVALTLLCAAHLALVAKLKGVRRLIPILIACFISILLMGHFFPGFHNWLIADKVRISDNGYPYSLYLNFDKPFIGFFPLALTIPLFPKRHRRSVVLKTTALTALGVLILTAFSLHLHFVAIDLKLPPIAPIWLIANLFLVTIPEEAFFRGFLQREINGYLKSKWGGFFSIVVVSLIFALFHFMFLRQLSYLFLTFIAGFIYGSVYRMTRSVEGSIFCHYLFNVIHFFSFTYPALK
ncbi:MAG: CPBP family intramembrane glutamic endopeptidase [Chlamydiota bacterium]